MKIKSGYLLSGINIISLALILFISFLPDNVLRLILGIPFLLFFPGYALTIGFFPRQGQLSGVERLAYGIGFSVALVILTGLVLNLTDWGIRLYPILVVLSGITLIFSLAAWFRQRRLPADGKYAISISPDLTGWEKNSALTKTLYLALAVVALGGLGYTIYEVANPRLTQSFTEFYVLGESGKAADYVRQVRQGDTVEVAVGIINHEKAAVSYQLAVTINGARASNAGPIVLDDGQKLEMPVTFKADKIGANQKVEFYLYHDGNTEPGSGPLRLWLNVVQ